MGGCNSISSRIQCQATQVIYSDGSLREFGVQIKAEEIILQNPDHFLCNSDSLYIDQYMVPVNSEEELEMGQLYFLLPLCKLQYVLSMSDMAAMLKRANSAIIRSTGCQYNWKIPTPRPKEKADWVAGGSGPIGSVRKTVFSLRRLETIHETLTSSSSTSADFLLSVTSCQGPLYA